MEWLKYHLSDEGKHFNGKQCEISEAEFILFGAPIDSTSTYRAGSREAPPMIRLASLNVETYSFRTEMDALDLKIHDAGDIPQTPNINEALNGISKIVSEIVKMGKKPIMIGGEHTVTYGAIKALKKPIIIFDAHMDLRDEYPYGVKMSHATVSRRIADEIGAENVSIIGVRATCKDEIEYARRVGLKYKTSIEVMESSAKDLMKEIKINGNEVWISIDMDVLDPSIAPGVGNPEPEGISVTKLLDILQWIVMNKKVVGFDLVEVSPPYDNGVTSITAAKIILELACMISKWKTRV